MATAPSWPGVQTELGQGALPHTIDSLLFSRNFSLGIDEVMLPISLESRRLGLECALSLDEATQSQTELEQPDPTRGLETFGL